MKSKIILTIVAIVVLSLSFTFCKKSEPYTAKLTDSAEKPVLPETPIDYPASQNDYLAALGRVLFYDKELSLNKNVACGTCHKQENAFCDNLQFSLGTNNLHTKRNTPSIFARNGRLFWDGRVNNFQELVFRPVEDKIEMNIEDITKMLHRLADIDYYSAIFPYAYPNATRIDSNMIKSAISEFLKNFNFSNNKFTRSEQNKEQLTASENLGKDLFFGKAKCSLCHHIKDDNFSGNSGYGNTNESHNIGLDATFTDNGVGGISGNFEEMGQFLMPVILNIEYTAPYMHDGRFKTLEEVIDHYDHGVKDNPNLDLRLRQYNSVSAPPQNLNLSSIEKTALVDFLKTLSDPSIYTDKRFSNPFVPR